MDFLKELYHKVLQLEGTERIKAPLRGILGVPQRAYGYTQGKIKHLQTANINYCMALSGHNARGAFLAHIDSYSFEEGQIPKMLDNLDRVLGSPINMTLVHNNGRDERQKYIPALKEMLLPFQKELYERTKGSMQSLNLGVDKTGKLYYPLTHAANQSNDQLEEWFFVRRGEGHAPDGYYRTGFDCVNESKGIIIPAEAFTEEQIPKWMNLKGSRAEVMARIAELFNLTPSDYAGMALGRRFSMPEKNGALVLI